MLKIRLKRMGSRQDPFYRVVVSDSRGFSGLNSKSDEAGFVAVYPNGAGAGPFLTFNSGGVEWGLLKPQPDDVAFVSKLLDDLAMVVHVGAKRVFATGMSNGGMMCYRLAAELSERIAAVAPVAGTMAVTEAKPKRPVPVLHFHGTEDGLVPYGGPDQRVPKFLTFKSVEDSVAVWVKLNGCHEEPVVEELPDTADDGTKVTRKTYRGDRGAEVVLVIVSGGGHNWPGRQPPFGLLVDLLLILMETKLISTQSEYLQRTISFIQG